MLIILEEVQNTIRLLIIRFDAFFSLRGTFKNTSELVEKEEVQQWLHNFCELVVNHLVFSNSIRTRPSPLPELQRGDKSFAEPTRRIGSCWHTGCVKLYRARSRLYRSQILQPNAHFSAFFEIYKIYNPLHRSDLEISAKNRPNF